MKTAISIIILLAVFLYIADTTIQIKPFKISFGNLSYGIACILFMLSFAFMSYSISKKAYEKGLIKGCEISREAVVKDAKEIIEQSQKTQQ